MRNFGPQGIQGGSTNISSNWQTAQGVMGAQTNTAIGISWYEMRGLVTTPSTGSPVIGVQAKGVQASCPSAILANSFLKVTVA
jgi:hypothetical protein